MAEHLADEQVTDPVREYSPAPWNAAPYKIESGADQEDFGSWAVYDARVDVLPLAILDHRRDGHPGFRKSVGAHARLIAAAPDLLEALKYVVRTYGFDSSTDSAIWKTAYAAIAKAEGRS